jgi:putative redox protein
MKDPNKSQWVSATIGTETYRTTITTDSHQLIGDEPVELGGKDLGPGPGSFVRIGLASCTAITLRMYANRKKMDVRKIEVKVYTELVGKKTVFHRTIEITGNITAPQRKRILQIADLCPVHKMLTNPVEIETTFVN